MTTRVAGCSIDTSLPTAGISLNYCDARIAAETQNCQAPAHYIPNPYVTLIYDNATGNLLRADQHLGTCTTEQPTTPAEPVTITVTEEQFRALPLTGSGLIMNPIREDHYYVNLPIFFHTNDTPQTLTTDILGTPVQIRATPISYTWDYGNGDTKTGTTPGTDYPDETYAQEYHSTGTYTTTLTTTWTGEYAINNGPWHPINGLAYTENHTTPYTVIESLPVLVNPPEDH